MFTCSHTQAMNVVPSAKDTPQRPGYYMITNSTLQLHKTPGHNARAGSDQSKRGELRPNGYIDHQWSVPPTPVGRPSQATPGPAPEARSRPPDPTLRNVCPRRGGHKSPDRTPRNLSRANESRSSVGTAGSVAGWRLAAVSTRWKRLERPGLTEKEDSRQRSAARVPRPAPSGRS